MGNLHLGIGDTIEVFKANMIIPQVANNLTMSDNIKIPDKCPVCGEPTVIETINKVKYLYCNNDFCPAKLIKRLSLFTSRNAMNIDGISDQILSRFISEGILTSYRDLYHLDDYKDEIVNYDGFGEKSYQNMIDSINKSRKVKLPNFIYALGIPEIGVSRAKLICNKYNNDFDKVRNLTFEELSAIDGVGDVIAKEWIRYFTNEEFIHELDDLIKELDFEKGNDKGNKLQDLTFVITGSINNFNNRDEMIEFIEQNGGKVVSSISSKVKYLINNDVNSTSTKNRMANELNIKIISEEEFMNMVGGK
jgi:DNA ligase (NAD+)